MFIGKRRRRRDEYYLLMALAIVYEANLRQIAALMGRSPEYVYLLVNRMTKDDLLEPRWEDETYGPDSGSPARMFRTGVKPKVLYFRSTDPGYISERLNETLRTCSFE